MKTLIAALILTSNLNLVATMNAQTAAAPLTPKSFSWQVKRSGDMRYLAYLPADYDATSGKRWPLMLFLHGAGERGTDVQRVAIHGPLSLVKRGTNFPFIIIAPQCPEGERWQNDSLLQLLEHVTKDYAVDERRIYLTGLSMGGYGTWSLGITNPERFAAIAPICGGGTRIDLIVGGREKAEALRSLPVWAFHGAKDPVVPLDESEQMVDALKRMGVKNVQFTVYPDADHNSWTQTYDNPAFYEWLLKQSR